VLAPVGWWRRRSTLSRVGLLAILGFAVLAGVNIWLQLHPPSPDANALHADILARRSEAEVTFIGVLVSDPTNSGDHERMVVRDRLGDTLELDYNTSLGRQVPVHAGSSIVIHGQLYIDPGRVGVHCLHNQTSRGCPQPGWIQFAGTTYS
jgi:hypothetical protein